MLVSATLRPGSHAGAGPATASGREPAKIHWTRAGRTHLWLGLPGSLQSKPAVNSPWRLPQAAVIHLRRGRRATDRSWRTWRPPLPKYRSVSNDQTRLPIIQSPRPSM